MSLKVLNFIQDRQGYLWIGTTEGLYKYNGYTYDVYERNDKDSTTLSDNWILSLVEDRTGTIWIGTNNGGLNSFNPQLNQFQRHILKTQNPRQGVIRTVPALVADSSGNIWIGTEAGLFLYDTQAGKFKELNIQIGNHNDKFSYRICSLHCDQNGIIWIGTNNGFSCFDPETGKSQLILYNPENTDHSPNCIAMAIKNDSQGKLWIGTDGAGLIAYNPHADTIKRYIKNLNAPNSISSNNITTLFVDENNHIWMGTKNSGGINVLDSKSGKISYLAPEHSQLDSRNDCNTINAIYEDRSGIIWIGTNEGICIYLQSKKQFFQLPSDKVIADQFDQWRIESICEDHLGNIWLGTSGDGLYSLDYMTGKAVNFVHDPNNPKSLSNNQIRSLHLDNKNDLWIGTDLGLNKFNREEQNFTRYYFNSTKVSLDDIDRINIIFQDGSEHLWLGMNGSGLIEFNPITGSFKNYGQNNGAIYGLSDPKNKIWTIYSAGDGNLLIGTLKGLYIFDTTNKIFNPFTTIKDEKNLNDDHILSLFKDKNGYLWIGSRGGGLIKFDPDQNTCKRFTKINGFPSNTIYTILPDKAGHLWMSSSKGIIQLNPQLNQFKTYTTDNGLQSDNFNHGACFKNKAGMLYFGSNNGFNAFYPEKIQTKAYVPPVVITNVTLTDESMAQNKIEAAIIRKDYLVKPLMIPYDKAHTISFESAVLDYTSPKNNQYRYQLEDYDQSWLPASKSRLVSYRGLGVGEYTFKMRGANSSGIWNEKDIRLKFEILPPFYRAWWAYGTYLFLLLVGCYFLRRFVVNRVLLKNQLQSDHLELSIQKEIDYQKSYFFTNISHQFRTPLTLILGPVEKWLQKHKNGDLHNDLKMIQKNCYRILRLINQLLELSRLDSGEVKLHIRPENIVEFLKGVVFSFTQLAKEKEINLSFISAQNSIIVYMDRDKIEDIVSNLLTNAFKYTPANGKISVSIVIKRNDEEDELFHNYIEIAIRDTGKGIAPEHIDKIFNRFYHLQEPVEIPEEGTGVGLSLAKELTELHQGKINVRSNLNHGSIFTVLLPLGKEHFDADTITEEQSPDELITHSRSHIYPGETVLITKSDGKINVKQSESSSPGDVPHILIVEDNLDVRLFLRKSLSGDYYVSEASNGAEGLEAVLVKEPDLIISDVMMPVMDGNEFCRRIKTNPLTSHIPVILLTARATTEGKIEGLETGADDYIFKPFDTTELLVRIKNLIAQRKKLQQRFREEIIIQPGEITATSTDKVFLERAISIVENHIGDPDFETQILADEVGMSRMNLHRKLKALTGQTPSQFVCSMRLKRAAQLIEQNAGNVTEVAYEVGFSSSSYFTQCFKSEFGILPSEFSKNHLFQG